MQRSDAVRRLWVVLTVVVAALLVSAPARADSTVDQVLWANCQNQSSGSLAFDSNSLTWPVGTTLRYSATVGADCGSLVKTSIVEHTRQANDNPMIITLGWGGGYSATNVRSVTPVRSLTWTLEVAGPLGTKVLGSKAITVAYPAGPLDRAHTCLALTADGVLVTGNDPCQRVEFVKAVETAGTVVHVAGNVGLDLSGLDDVRIAPNVQIIGDHSADPLGPLLFTDTVPANLFEVPVAASLVGPQSQERISGIRLRGGSSTDPFENLGDEDSNGIMVRKGNVEIDHNEISLWRGAGIMVRDCDECSTPYDGITNGNGKTVSIHDNYIHHNQHPTGDLIPGGHGGGYGVAVDGGAYALVERNVFNYNRHAMMGGGGTRDGYFFYRNLILPDGQVNSRGFATHAIDMHGTTSCDFYGIPIPGDHECGIAGQYMDIQYNTVWNRQGGGVKLRGQAEDKMEVRHNVFVQCSLWGGSPSGCSNPSPALEQTQSGIQASDNTLGYVDGNNRRTVCDFDGDGVNDTFTATGVTWWMQSSRLGGRYVYLNQSTVTGSAFSLGDVNGDGLCDVTAGGQSVTTDPDVTVGANLWTTVPFLVTVSDPVAKDALARAGLTVGTVTVRPSASPAGTVLDQGQHFNYVRPKGFPVDLVESGGQSIVPNVLSLDASTARTYISQAGLVVSGTSYTNNCVDPGSVQNQNPSGGVAVFPGSGVHITVSTCTGSGGGGGGGGGPVRPK